MGKDRESWDEEALLARNAWVRALARRLVYDPHAVDDVVQQAWLETVQRPPRGSVPWRRWVVHVVRNLARQRGRREQRRRRRERVAARPEATEPPDEVVARAESHRRVVEAVLALEEPYRTTILLRYFDRLPPRRVAQRMGAPVATVHTRHRRALQRLRQALDERAGGDGKAWLGALLPLLALSRPGAAALVWAGGTLLMGKKIAWGAAALLVVAAFVWMGRNLGVQPEASPHSRKESAAPPAPGQPPTEPHRRTTRDGKYSGRVVDGEGNAVRDASLFVLNPTDAPPIGGPGPVGPLLERYRRLEETQPRAADVRTDANGRFRIRAEPRAKLLILASGFLAQVARAPTDGRDVRLQPQPATAGKVLDTEDQPVAGARVRLLAGELYRLAAPVCVAEIRTDEEGRFDFPDQAAGVGLLVEQADHPPLFHRFYPDALRRIRSGRQQEITVVLQEWRDLRGVILRADTREPIAGAWVSAGYSWADSAPWSTRTGEDGSFVLRHGLPSNQAGLVVDAGPLGNRELGYEFADVEGPIEVLLEPATTIRGVVRAPEGESIERLWVYSVQPQRVWRRSRIARDGTFEISDVAGDARIWVLFDPWHPTLEDATPVDPKRRQLRSLPPPGSPGFPADLTLTLQLKATIAGRLVDSLGGPLPEAEMQFVYGAVLAGHGSLGLAWISYAHEMSPCDEQGRFLWRGVTRRFGPIAVRVTAPGCVGTIVHVTPPEAGVRRAEATLTLERGRTIRGVVRFESGEPAAGVRVWAAEITDPGAPDHERKRDRATTDARGRYVLDGISAGRTYYLNVKPPRGYLRAPYQKVPADVEADPFVLRRGYAVEGLVRDESGRPLAAYVQLRRPGTNGERARCDREGYFRFDALEAGTYSGHVSATGCLARNLEGITVPRDKPLEVTLSRGQSIRGVVLGSAGEPVALAQVKAERTSPAGFRRPGHYGQAFTDAKGRFEIAGLSDGTFKVRVDRGVKGGDVFDEVEGVVAGQEIVIRGRAGLHVEGVVLGAGDKPEEGVHVKAWGAGPGASADAWTDEEGHFRIGPLRPARYALFARKGGKPECGHAGDVEAGACGIRIVLGRGAVIGGRVVDSEGKPTDANLTLGWDDHPVWYVQIFAQKKKGSRFRLAGLPPGKLRLRVMPRNMQTTTARGGTPVEAGREDLELILEDS